MASSCGDLPLKVISYNSSGSKVAYKRGGFLRLSASCLFRRRKARTASAIKAIEDIPPLPPGRGAYLAFYHGGAVDVDRNPARFIYKEPAKGRTQRILSATYGGRDVTGILSHFTPDVFSGPYRWPALQYLNSRVGRLRGSRLRLVTCDHSGRVESISVVSDPDC